MEKPSELKFALAKIRKAKSSIPDFNQRVERFLHSDSYRVARTLDAEGLCDVWLFRVSEEAPYDIAVELGGILHLLRTSLDNIICGLAGMNGKRSDDLYFPFAKQGRAAVEDRTAMKGDRLPDQAKRLIRELKPYPGGNDLLWLLHDANREDKHRSMKIVSSGLRIYVGRVQAITGDVLSIGDRRGQSLVRKIVNGKKGLAALSEDTRGTLRIIEGRNYIEFRAGRGSTEHEIEFMRTTMGAEVEADIHPALDIILPESSLPEREKATRALSELADIVEEFVLSIERRCFS